VSEQELELRILKEIEPVITGMGCDVVEVRIGRAKKSTEVLVVIYKSDGVRIDDCAVISKTIHPRLELYEELGNVILKVASPGVDRILKSRREFELFKGKGISVLLIDANTWIGGILEGIANETLLLGIGDKQKKIRLSRIKKVKLDYTQEVI
jgi:ribosome maturation factor RimP